MDCLNSHNFDGIGPLFADPTDVTGPDGLKYRHPADVVAFIKHGFKAMTSNWRFQTVNLVPIGRNGCLLEFEVSEDNGAFEPVAVDHIEVNTYGKITRFIPYVASSRVAKTVELQRQVHAEVWVL